jgi:hypothetical protein
MVLQGTQTYLVLGGCREFVFLGGLGNIVDLATDLMRVVLSSSDQAIPLKVTPGSAREASLTAESQEQTIKNNKRPRGHIAHLSHIG